MPRSLRLVSLLLVVLTGLLLLASSPPKCCASDEPGPSARVLQEALAALSKHRKRVASTRVITVIDYDLAFTSERLWLVEPGDAKAEPQAWPKVVLSSRVSHAFKSGLLYATRFSNRPGSNLSSAGSYVTARSAYQGAFGHSLRVHGLDRGVNDNAHKRAIIFHPDLGMTHSLGCFMLPDAISRRVIDTIAGGTFVYVHREQALREPSGP